VGLVFENPDDQLFSPTVLEDVAYGPLYMGLPREEVLQRAARALAQVGMTGFEERSPHRLSLGQKKRIAIATVLSMEPAILALDEPTASLDPRARRELIHLLRELPQTMLVSTHDIPLVRNLLPRTVVMDGGVIVADGETQAILSDATLLAAHGLDVF
jgi:energy-coupling factor transporter ATP-binding protein EcfA2